MHISQKSKPAQSTFHISAYLEQHRLFTYFSSRGTWLIKRPELSLRAHPFHSFRDLGRERRVDLLHPRGLMLVQGTDRVDFLDAALLAEFHLRGEVIEVGSDNLLVSVEHRHVRALNGSFAFETVEHRLAEARPGVGHGEGSRTLAR